MTRPLSASTRAQRENLRLGALRKIKYLQIPTAFCRILPILTQVEIGVMAAGRDRRMPRIKGVLALDLDSHTSLGGLQTTPPSAQRARAYSCANLHVCMTSTATYNPRPDPGASHVSVSMFEQVLQINGRALHTSQLF